MMQLLSPSRLPTVRRPRGVFEDLSVDDAIKPTAGLLERHARFRRISRATERFGTLRNPPAEPDYRGPDAPAVTGCSASIT